MLANEKKLFVVRLGFRQYIPGHTVTIILHYPVRYPITVVNEVELLLKNTSFYWSVTSPKSTTLFPIELLLVLEIDSSFCGFLTFQCRQSAN